MSKLTINRQDGNQMELVFGNNPGDDVQFIAITNGIEMEGTFGYEQALAVVRKQRADRAQIQPDVFWTPAGDII